MIVKSSIFFNILSIIAISFLFSFTSNSNCDSAFRVIPKRVDEKTGEFSVKIESPGGYTCEVFVEKGSGFEQVYVEKGNGNAELKVENIDDSFTYTVRLTFDDEEDFLCKTLQKSGIFIE